MNPTDKTSISFLQKYRLPLALTLLLLLIGVGMYFYHKNFQEKYLEQAKINLKSMADNLASDHEGSIYGIRQFLITSGYLVEQAENDKDTCASILRRMYVVYPYFLNIGITDSEGHVLCSGVDIGKPISLANESDFMEAKQKQQFSISGYKISATTGRPSVRFLQPIIEDGIFNGVLFVSFATEWLNGFSPSFDLPLGTVVTKFDKNGIVFFRHPNPLTWSGTDQSDSELFKAIQENRIGFFEAEGLEGNKRFYYFRPIYQEGEIHAYIAVGSNIIDQ